jgi:HD-GYP domain-containing protein (c-di-GMP phosphodiesterase class II)
MLRAGAPGGEPAGRREHEAGPSRPHRIDRKHGPRHPAGRDRARIAALRDAPARHDRVANGNATSTNGDLRAVRLRGMTVPMAERLADLLGALSLATDLGIGARLETSLRTCAIATHLGRSLGVTGPALSVTYYAGLLRHVGCTAWSHEAAALAGDDHELIRTFEGVDPSRRTAVLGRAVRGLRVRAVARVLTHPSAGARLAAAQCAQAEAFANDLGLDAEVGAALAQMYEHHDGTGTPRGLRRDAITPAARLVHAAQIIEALHRRVGRDVTLAELRRRRGRQLAPEVCDAAIAEAERLWTILEAPSAWELALDAEPEPRRALDPARLGEIALAFARFADLKVPQTVGHSPAVAALAVAAAAGWPADEIEALRIAALLHDLGSVSVGNPIWEQPGALGAGAWEQVRLHAYYTERILARTPLTAPIAAIAGAHHERLDGGGYHRGAPASALPRAARLLAAADSFTAMGERRPHRAAHSAEARARLLAEEAAAGRLCRDAVALVLAAAGHGPPRRALPAGLTEREADVLGLLARGLATKEIAAALGIAPRTVKHHIEHVYDKTGVSSRAAAALFAARHDLVAPDPDRPSGR